jgi:hypothetical protein
VYGELGTQFEAPGFLLRDNLQEVCVPVLTYVRFILLWQKKREEKERTSPQVSRQLARTVADEG